MENSSDVSNPDMDTNTNADASTIIQAKKAATGAVQHLPTKVANDEADDDKPSTSKRAREKLESCLELNLDPTKPNWKSLAEAMSVEKIAAIKAKRLAIKKSAAAALFEQQVRTARRKICEPEPEMERIAEVVAMAVQRERQHISREQLLMGEQELLGVLPCLARVFNFETRRMIEKPPATDSEEEGSPSPGGKPKQKEREKERKEKANPLIIRMEYNRYGQERFLKPVAVSDKFGINPLGTNMVKEPLFKEPRPPQRLKPHPYLHHMVQHSLHPAHPPPPHRALHRLPRRLPHCVQPQPYHLPDYSPCMPRPICPPYHYGLGPSSKPIIVVPGGPTSIITLYNVKELLQEMRYVPSEQMRVLKAERLQEVILERRFQNYVLRYRVIDNIRRLTSEDWQRVAAVFVHGPLWQFKGWPWQGDPTVIFHHVCAFHLRFKEKPTSREIENLWVNILSLPQYDRHLDCGILMEFWNKLDQHIAHNDRQFTFMKQQLPPPVQTPSAQTPPPFYYNPYIRHNYK